MAIRAAPVPAGRLSTYSYAASARTIPTRRFLVAAINVLSEILTWSADRPLWQRDALRRMITQGDLKEADYLELTEFCKSTHGLRGKMTPEPLEAKHLPASGAASKPVSMKSLTHLAGVNALAQNQTVQFGPALTIVYGANAAGKSGYTRILKRACRARGAEEVLGNVVSGVAPGRPSAKITYEVDGATHEFLWDDDLPADRFLSRVSVFDRHCASVYIAEETDVAFRPLGLDLFDKLSDACEAVRRLLEKERKALEMAAVHLPDVPAGTDVHELLSRLTSLTNPEEVKRLATLTDAEGTSIGEHRARLRELQSDDPQKSARALELRVKRLEALARKIRTISDALSESAVDQAAAVRKRMLDASRLAEEMRRSTFESQPLPNTGSESWRALWSAAERFSTIDAYPDDVFPVVGTNARCVLCQQKLRDDGLERFRRFHEFLSSEIQRERDEAVSRYEQVRKPLAAIVVLDTPTSEALDELHLEDHVLADAARAFLADGEYRRVAVLNALGNDAEFPSQLRTGSVTPPDLAAHVLALQSRIQELRDANRADAIGRIEGPLRQLEARQILGQHTKDVLAEIERKKRLAAYQLCLDEAKTTAITRKSSEVTKLAVTEQLARSFKDELSNLNFKHVEVEMAAAGGSRGALYHKLQLRRAPGVSVPRVVSEGEARCLSIASFFAELSTAADRSAILFDDPVSSLDHHWRESVAGRLAVEAKCRQVIIFTHDIVFLLALVNHAEKAEVEIRHQTLRRGSTTSGVSTDGLPDPAMKVSARISFLKNLLQNAAKFHKENKPEEYEHAGTRIYGLLRQAWERGVEEVLLYGVVERYRPSVETNKARFLVDITKDDCDALHAGMTKCSKWEGGHDHAAALGTPFPEPGEVEKDIQALDAWVAALRPRRR